MPIFSLDEQSRLQIRAALLASCHCDVYAQIDLADGNSLLMLAHAGNIAFCLVDREGDLFDPRSMQDVGALVLHDLHESMEMVQVRQHNDSPAFVLLD